MKRMPTGINVLDKEMEGGVPEGSFNLLYGETGTRKDEFAHTIAYNCIAIKQDRSLVSDTESLFLPRKLWYTVFEGGREDILRNVKGTFSEKFYKKFSNNVSFKIFQMAEPLSDLPDWMVASGGEKGEEGVERRKKVISKLIKFLQENLGSNLVFLHYFTEMVRTFEADLEMDVTSLIQFIQRLCRKKDGVVFAPLTKSITSQDLEESVISSSDAVFEFETSGKELRKRQNIMHVRKCQGVPSDLQEPFRVDRTSSGIELERVRTLL